MSKAKGSRLKKSSKKQASKTSNATSTRVASPVMSSGTAKALGIKLVSVTRKKVVAEMPIKKLHMNRTDRVNGGALMAFADVLGAVGTVANLPPGYRTTTLESKTNFFAAGMGPVLFAVSIPLHVGRTTNVWQTTVKNGDGRTVAIVTQTQIVLAPRKEQD
jgi:1,4-dihydroxy-2-naphthoyl-CoA hydrolase